MESILKEREELDLIKERLEKTDKERESMGQNAWTSLNIHYQRSGKFECESAHNKRRKG